MLGSLFVEEDEVDIKNLGFPSRKLDVKSPPLPRSQCRLSGISNQGATCYLNSLLQTLLLTPEFRENLFLLSEHELGRLADKDKEDAKVRVIPLELQRLFVQLLLGDRQSVLTTDLTNSFGWTNNEELQQHDVQELNRILFSAIEESLVGTSGSDLIQTLYHGKIVNQIICDVCGKVSEREEDFLDLCVTVAGSESLESGLADSYCQMEVMNGQNQYRCGQCNKLVDARKGAKLRCLPEILTISLLRFSFDYIKLERYKETGKYMFPMRLNMAKYCEKDSTEEQWYDLFSIVIHRGGAHGGHYYAYIRDVDAIGQWTHPDEETLEVPADPSTGEVDFIQCDSPIELIQAVLANKPNQTLSLDKLGGEINSQTGVSWSKRFKRQYGPLNKFLAKYDDKFVLDTSSKQVSLRRYNTPRDGSGEPTSLDKSTPQSHKDYNSKKRSASPPPPLGSCWFSFDDVRVHPIREQEIQKTFSGKSSAYMLFYRKSTFERPSEAMGNPSYQIPDSLIAEVLEQNELLRIEREEYDMKMNELNLQIHFRQWYQYNNGALHPIDYQSSFLQLVIDRRKNIEDLKIAIMELGGELIDSEFVIHRMKEIPSGFHLYDDISIDNDKQIKDLYVEDGTMLFVWDGVQVGGSEVQTGILYEPVLLNISTGTKQHAVIRGFPKNMSLKSLQRHLCDILNLDCDSTVIKRIVGEEERKIVTFTFDQYEKSLSEVKLKDGDELLIDVESQSSSSENVPMSSHQQPKVFLAIENRCKNTQNGAQLKCRIEAEKSQTIGDIKTLAINKCGLTDNAESYRLRVDDEHIGLRPPMYEQLTIDDYGLNKFLLIILEEGEAPKSNEMTLTIMTSSCDLDLPDFDITIDRNSTVDYCLQCSLNWAGLSDDNWHLRKTNWCGEAAELLDDMESKLETCLVQHGDRLLLEKGRIPPKGFIRPAIWLYPTPPRHHHGNGGGDQGSMVSWITQGLSSLWNGLEQPSSTSPTSEPILIGDVEISLKSTLDDLKIQIMTLNSLSDVTIPTTDFMRVRVFSDGRLGGILRGSNATLQKLKLKSCDKLAIQILPQEESLNINQVVLEVSKRIPNTKTYESATEVLWDTSQGATVQSLKQMIADACFIQQELISLAKHFPTKYEWMVIKEQAKKQAQQQKSKKKATKINLRQAPYSIQDGDTIGVKNLQFDPLKTDDFSTEADEIGRAELNRLAEEKRKQRKERKEQSEGGIEFNRPKRPEVGLTIKVENFRS
ncbi:hypothetical protein FSP39_022933 [Pinctada imbricata]|uniref:USP domain-containing protein n=1 Tax=Pinctada imbricata TaxID=66713 RepID=A0AA89C483_PINIB|nr:hypothetical protein FSP39_022933 [Pinctada imbricata]